MEVAAEPTFAKPVLSLEANATTTALQGLEPGHYVGRVIALGAEGLASLPSPALPFTVERPTPWWMLLFLLPAL